MCLLNKKLKK